MKQKIAFLILAHKDPDMLKCLIHSLDYELFDIFVHIDAKTNIKIFGFESYCMNYAGLYVTKNRVKVYWGDYSVVQATINMLIDASDRGLYSRYVTLSGNDYPLKSNREIYTVLSQKSIEFIMGSPLKRLEKIHLYHIKRYGVLGRKITDLLRLLGIHRNKKPLIIDGEKMIIFFAPQWFALTDSCVSYILETIERNRKTIKGFFRFSYAPDELLIPTIVFNSEFAPYTIRDSFPEGTHYNDMPAVHFINYDPIVQVFDETHADMLLHSNKLFARKLSMEKSQNLIEIIETNR